MTNSENSEEQRLAASKREASRKMSSYRGIISGLHQLWFLYLWMFREAYGEKPYESVVANTWRIVLGSMYERMIPDMGIEVRDCQAFARLLELSATFGLKLEFVEVTPTRCEWKTHYLPDYTAIQKLGLAGKIDARVTIRSSNAAKIAAVNPDMRFHIIKFLPDDPYDHFVVDLAEAPAGSVQQDFLNQPNSIEDVSIEKLATIEEVEELDKVLSERIKRILTFAWRLYPQLCAQVHQHTGRQAGEELTRAVWQRFSGDSAARFLATHHLDPRNATDFIKLFALAEPWGYRCEPISASASRAVVDIPECKLSEGIRQQGLEGDIDPLVTVEAVLTAWKQAASLEGEITVSEPGNGAAYRVTIETS